MHELISSAEANRLARLPNYKFISLDQIQVRDTHHLDRKKIQKIKRHLESGGMCSPIEIRSADTNRYLIAGD